MARFGEPGPRFVEQAASIAPAVEVRVAAIGVAERAVQAR
jgi:hypothetical protein